MTIFFEGEGRAKRLFSSRRWLDWVNDEGQKDKTEFAEY